jgi:pyridoxal phosphate enzyme (YggS family)
VQIIINYNQIINKISLLSKSTKLIVVCKNQDLKNIDFIIKQGHSDFGENKVQEASFKWKNIILNNSQLQLHLLGKLQSNKAKDAFKIFTYIHTLDTEKLAKIFSKLENENLKKIKYFIQVNIGNEPQKNGISVDQVSQFTKYCLNDLKLNIIGLMCIPPYEDNSSQYFKKLSELAIENNLKELSMGMSNDYECAINNGATFVRIGSKIFSKI